MALSQEVRSKSYEHVRVGDTEIISIENTGISYIQQCSNMVLRVLHTILNVRYIICAYIWRPGVHAAHLFLIDVGVYLSPQWRAICRSAFFLLLTCISLQQVKAYVQILISKIVAYISSHDAQG